MLAKFEQQFGEKEIDQVTSQDLFNFLIQNTEGQKQTTKRLKFTLIKALFNFVSTNIDESFPSPCNSQVLKKSFRDPVGRQWTILEKDVVDEIIFRTENPRNRLMLELMARGGMRVGEVLKLRAGDVDDRKLSINSPKSGRHSEVVFIPKKVAERLKDYIRSKEMRSGDHIFPMGYTGARAIVKKAGRAVGMKHMGTGSLLKSTVFFVSLLKILSKVLVQEEVWLGLPGSFVATSRRSIMW